MCVLPGKTELRGLAEPCRGSMEAVRRFGHAFGRTEIAPSARRIGKDAHLLVLPCFQHVTGEVQDR